MNFEQATVEVVAEKEPDVRDTIPAPLRSPSSGFLCQCDTQCVNDRRRIHVARHSYFNDRFWFRQLIIEAS